MCDFCEKEKEYFTNYKGYLIWFDDKKLHICGENSEDKMEINYCPMCGKKL